MANALTYFADPALLTQQAISGKAQLIPDPAAAFWASLFKGLNYNHGFEVVDATATALSTAVYRTDLKISGTMTATIAAPAFDGQRKKIAVVSAGSTPALTLTITNPETATGYVCASTFFFDTVGQIIELIGVGGLWRAERITRCGGVADAVVIGTTVINTFNLWDTYYCSVTGSVSSSTTKGIPNGSAIGEEIKVAVSTGALIPSGTITLTGVTNAGAAATTLGTLGATTCYALLRWNGQAWQVRGNTTLVLS